MSATDALLAQAVSAEPALIAIPYKGVLRLAFNTAETAELLGRTADQVRDLINSGALFAIDGRYKTVPAYAIAAYLRGIPAQRAQ